MTNPPPYNPLTVAAALAHKKSRMAEYRAAWKKAVPDAGKLSLEQLAQKQAELRKQFGIKQEETEMNIHERIQELVETTKNMTTAELRDLSKNGDPNRGKPGRSKPMPVFSTIYNPNIKTMGKSAKRYSSLSDEGRKRYRREVGHRSRLLGRFYSVENVSEAKKAKPSLGDLIRQTLVADAKVKAGRREAMLNSLPPHIRARFDRSSTTKAFGDQKPVPVKDTPLQFKKKAF